MWLVNYLINEIWFHVACTNFYPFKDVYNCRMKKKKINRQSNSEVMIKSMPVITPFPQAYSCKPQLFFHGLFKDLVRPANYYL